jgi:hypothetical protein
MSEKITTWENIKVPKAVVNKLRTYKKKTGVSLMAFTKNAILEKLEREKLLLQKETV